MNNGSVGIDRLSISVYSLFNRQMKRALITSKQTAVFFFFPWLAATSAPVSQREKRSTLCSHSHMEARSALNASSVPWPRYATQSRPLSASYLFLRSFSSRKCFLYALCIRWLHLPLRSGLIKCVLNFSLLWSEKKRSSSWDCIHVFGLYCRLPGCESVHAHVPDVPIGLALRTRWHLIAGYTRHEIWCLFEILQEMSAFKIVLALETSVRTAFLLAELAPCVDVGTGSPRPYYW